MPASASTSGRPAAIAEPNATNNKMIVGRPDSSSALWRAFSFSALKSCHTAHSPVTSTFAPAGNDAARTKDMSSPADSGRCASFFATSSTGIKATVPSGEINPAATGRDSGSTTDPAPGAPANAATKARSPVGSSAIGVCCE